MVPGLEPWHLRVLHRWVTEGGDSLTQVRFGWDCSPASPARAKPSLAKCWLTWLHWPRQTGERFDGSDRAGQVLGRFYPCAFPLAGIYGPKSILQKNELNLFLREAAHTRAGFVSQLSPRPSPAQASNPGKAIVEMLLVRPVGNQSQPLFFC